MKKFQWMFLLLVGLMMGIIAVISKPVTQVSAKPEPTEKPDKKMNICHHNEGKNKWEGIEISESAWDKHEEHGDFLYNGPLDKNGKPDNKDKKADIWCEENVPQDPKDYCRNFEGIQAAVPDGMTETEGYCDCADGYHRVYPEENEQFRTLVNKEYDNFSCTPDDTNGDDPGDDPTDEPDPGLTDRKLTAETTCEGVFLRFKYVDDGNGVSGKQIRFVYHDETKFDTTDDKGVAKVSFGYRGAEGAEAYYDGGKVSTGVPTEPTDCDESVGGGDVLGVSTGQVLGASTMAATGTIASSLYSLAGIAGMALTAVGIKRYGKKN